MSLPNDPPLNPYAAPQAELQPVDTRQQRSAKTSLRSWLIVFLVNLPLPTLIGSQMCDRNGRLGMLAMVVLMLLLSSWLVVAKPWIGRRLIAGGVGVAISQGLPILHLMIAVAVTFFVEAFGLYTPPPPVDYMDGPGGFLEFFIQYSPPAMMFLTFFVGLGLMLAAFACGWLPIFADPNEPPEEDRG